MIEKRDCTGAAFLLLGLCIYFISIGYIGNRALPITNPLILSCFAGVGFITWGLLQFYTDDRKHYINSVCVFFSLYVIALPPITLHPIGADILSVEARLAIAALISIAAIAGMLYIKKRKK